MEVSPGNSRKKSWTDLYNELGTAATDTLLNKPPKEKSLGFLRRCSVLATLCNYVYSFKKSDEGSKSYIGLPLEGHMSDVAPVTANLLHFREAIDNGEISGPQQFGIWSVTCDPHSSEDDFIAVVFRGTSSLEDVLVDVNITPQPLSSGSQSHLKVHKGFHMGATEHVVDIVNVLRETDVKAGRVLPVWVAGHSLGGAYANALILHLLDSRRTNELFKSGGGSCTFGAPMIVHSADREEVYKQLASLEEAVQIQEGSNLSFHNFVNNADPVPRSLGGSLDAVHGFMEARYPGIKQVRKTANQYHPFGQYHLIIGSEVRSLSIPVSNPSMSSRLGGAEYATRLAEQLDLRYMWRMLYGSTGKGAGWTPHSMTSYQERLSTYMEALLRTQTMDNEETGVPKSLFSSADRLELSREESSKLGAEMGTLLQSTALHVGSQAYTWWTAKKSSVPQTNSSQLAARSQTESTPASSSNKENNGQNSGSAWASASKWVRSSRWLPPSNE